MSIFDKIIKFLGFEVEEKENPQKEKKKTKNVAKAEYDLKKDILSEEDYSKEFKNKIETNESIEVFVAKNQNDIQNAIMELKNKKTLKIKLSEIDESNYIRIMDFMFGAIFALNGEIAKLDEFNYILKIGE